jgi:S-(hydroxymethyl)glutathione dehydrogenase / alcohol dehydrogenase
MCQSGRVCLCNGYSTPRGYLIDGTARLYNAKGHDIQQMARIGTMSQYSVVPQESVIPIASHYPLDRAALVGCGVTTGVGAVFNTAHVEPGSTVAVIGVGGVGLNVIQGAQLAQAARIIAVDVVDDKDELITHTYRLDEINEAFVDMEAGKNARGVILFDH